MANFEHFIARIILLFLFFSKRTFSLNATESKVFLLSPRSSTAAVFDGVDTVYIFGGWYYDPVEELIPYADIHAYNISSDTIKVVGQLPRTSWSGIIHHDAISDDIFLLRGDGTYLWHFVPSTGATHSVTQWFGNSASITGAFTEDNKLVTFGGLENPTQVYQFDFVTGEQGQAGILPLMSQSSVGIHLREKNYTYIFAGELGNRNPILLRHDHQYNRTTILNIEFPSWRHGDGVLVSVGTSIYIVGAIVDNGARGNGFVQYIPESGQVNFIPVEGLPRELSDFSAVYVESLKRIYLFGGYDITNVDKDGIWFVDL